MKKETPHDFEEMLDYHLSDHATLLEMIHTLANHMGVYLSPVIEDDTVTYEVKPLSCNRGHVRCDDIYHN